MNSPATNDYTKLTVAQLKALCKDRKISGYSKLSKPALIQKLVDHDSNSSSLASGATVPQSSSIHGPSTLNSINNKCDTIPDATIPEFINRTTPRTAQKYASTPSQSLSRGSVETPSHSSLIHGPSPGDTIAQSCPAKHPLAPAVGDRILACPPSKPIRTAQSKALVDKKPSCAIGSKRTGSVLESPSLKRLKSGEYNAPRPSVLQLSTNVAKELSPSKTVSHTPTLPEAPIAMSCVTVASQKKPPKRFKPLIMGCPVTKSRPNLVTSSLTAEDSSSIPPQSFEFSTSQFDSDFKPISLPPPLSQRKRVQGWAIILSGVDNESRKACSLVSRTFRYAVYLSAVPILRRKFGGKRLDVDIEKYSQAMTNFWPYLRFREDEAVRNRRIYEHSFLYRLEQDGKANRIASPLWGHSDNPKQLTMAVRFVLSSLWFALSVGGRDSENWLRGTIVDAQEVAKGEIWEITVQTDNAQPAIQEETFFVLEQTCEVIGRLQSPVSGSALSSDLRADWSTYLQTRLAAAGGGSDAGSSVLKNLRWAHQEEYDRGISKLWLKRLEGEGKLGKLKRIVAERYVLACVMANSISGQWMSTAQMVQEFASLPDLQAPSTKGKEGRALPINLYLPAPHHIESVHFTTSSGKPLHPALAVIQTPSREYFVLRDNGMQVGSEEEGVSPLWMEVLNCNNQGSV